jgi:hypothetical protein
MRRNSWHIHRWQPHHEPNTAAQSIGPTPLPSYDRRMRNAACRGSRHSSGWRNVADLHLLPAIKQRSHSLVLSLSPAEIDMFLPNANEVDIILESFDKLLRREIVISVPRCSGNHYPAGRLATWPNLNPWLCYINRNAGVLSLQASQGLSELMSFLAKGREVIVYWFTGMGPKRVSRCDSAQR